MKAALIAGDRRQRFLAELMEKGGFRVQGYMVPGFGGNKENLRDVLFGAELVVLPCPMGKGTAITAGNRSIELSEVIDSMQWGSCLAGGKPSPEAALLSGNMGCPVYDYFSPEPMQLMNAVPTAEGALALAIGNTDGTIFGSNALILGFGRCAQRLALLLLAAGAHVAVAARRSEARALAESLGCRAVDIGGIHEVIGECHVVFNTVPAKLLEERELRLLQPSAPYIELASSPGGLRREDAAACGIRYVEGGALPGRFAPKAAAEYIFRQLVLILKERGQL